MTVHSAAAPAVISATTPTAPITRAGASWLLLPLLLLALLGCNRGLWTPDEPREAEISREMLLVPAMIPTLNGQRFIEKPPLYYWTVAAIFRLTGGPSVLAARAVSVLSGIGTLALLYAWGAAEHSRLAGLTAAGMLATSVQFLVSSHWVLIDPLLMLCTTAAAWAAWQLLCGRGAMSRARALFYVALILALWIKGLIGPVLIGAGLLLYVAVARPVYWRRLQPMQSCIVLVLAIGLLAYAIYRQGGRAALWEWGYVNHVQRLLDPGITGHRQPLLYYVWTLPYAALPWLPALLEALRPVHWRRAAAAPTGSVDVARFAALLSAGMLLVLSASATKRETYLLPVLPLLFLWLGVRSAQQSQTECVVHSAWQWTQLGLLSAYCVAAPVAALVWTGSVAWPVWPTLLIGVLCVVLLWWAVLRRPTCTGGAMFATAIAGAALLLVLAPPLLQPMKDMAPFIHAVGRTLPQQLPVVATGVDETLAAEIPFYTGRALLPLRGDSASPEWLLVQDNDGHATSPASYRLILRQAFGPRRILSLWQRSEH